MSANKQTWKVCNACMTVWTGNGNCPECGSDDWDMERDEERFTGGLDADRERSER